MTRNPGGSHERAVDRPSGPGHPRIAVDLLGGDHAPAVVVDGALRACRSDPRLELLLVGPRSVADEITGALTPIERPRVALLSADRGVRMGDPAGHGVDRHTSIGAAASALASGRVDAVVSAGATGATVAAAVVATGRACGVRRPALAAILPGPAGAVVMLDVGAGLRVNPVELVQHAALGAGYARLAVGVRAPRVGLLSIGSEPGKGDRLRRAADAALRVHPLPEASYVGLVEGDEIVLGHRADVIVTDGFTGNVLLKVVEAVFRALPGSLPHEAVPRAAALLGVGGTVVVCHGVASEADVASGVTLAARLVRQRVMSRLIRVSGLTAPGRASSGAGPSGAGPSGAGSVAGEPAYGHVQPVTLAETPT